MSKAISVIIPARNEVALIGAALEATLVSARELHWSLHPQTAPAPTAHLDETCVEVIVVDNHSSDGTAEVVQTYARAAGVRLLACDRLCAPCARNFGAQHSTGRILVFVDGDTLMPRETLGRILHHCEGRGYQAGITGLASLEGGWSAGLWWLFWGQVRRLPLPRAKAMPALMFCTRAAFDTFGPFDESVRIGEEWPILAGVYAHRPARFIYDRSLTALTSSRRMELQPCGYLRTFLRYVWAVLHPSGRVDYPDHIRHPGSSTTAEKGEARGDSPLFNSPTHLRTD